MPGVEAAESDTKGLTRRLAHRTAWMVRVGGRSVGERQVTKCCVYAEPTAGDAGAGSGFVSQLSDAVDGCEKFDEVAGIIVTPMPST